MCLRLKGMHRNGKIYLIKPFQVTPPQRAQRTQSNKYLYLSAIMINGYLPDHLKQIG
jgi:hypothetical protein